MIFLYGCYLALKGVVWCFGAMIWLCLAVNGIMLVGLFALLCIPLGIGGKIWHRGVRSLAPPDWLRRKSHA